MLRSKVSCGNCNLTRFVSDVAVIGCGLMGSGIAAVSAGAGYNVKVLSLSDDRLKQSKDRVSEVLCKLAKNKSGGFADSAMARIKFTTDITTAVSDSQLVVEAVTEDLRIKRTLFQSVERLAPNSCVLASNTSALSVNEIAKVLSRKESFGGLHFFNPVRVMKLVEITRCRHTSEDTLKTLAAFAESLGKTVIHCKDTPGFIVNRLLVPYLLEAIEMWERCDASLDDIETAMRLGAGHPMGPFELADHVGLDTLLHILVHWAERHPEERAFRLNATVRQFVAHGRFGKKCGYGFFKYDQSGRIVKEKQ
ncbi:hydroxyacyl coenzyme a dehydrogenase [Echinococcus multilocularis]|uniref:Hydroxyacyl coenzyme a dehydrogenase n=1 Tax=Echinococcus multilocularis TaxID=6211 RepID=A0A068Y2H0_ECHMU|nr:hydroxyacyl coenzyme a dehydrogenase [Echinococcus multilocularis]